MNEYSEGYENGVLDAIDIFMAKDSAGLLIFSNGKTTTTMMIPYVYI